MGYLPALELGQLPREQGVLDAPRHVQFLLDGMVEGLDLSVGFLELPARALSPGAAALEYPGDPEEQQAHGYAIREHECGQAARGLLLELRQRSEVQAPIASGHLYPAFPRKEGIVPPLPSTQCAGAVVEERARRRVLLTRFFGAPYAIAVIEECSRLWVLAVVDFEVYGGLKGPSEDFTEQSVHHEGADGKPLKRVAPLCD